MHAKTLKATREELTDLEQKRMLRLSILQRCGTIDFLTFFYGY